MAKILKSAAIGAVLMSSIGAVSAQDAVELKMQSAWNETLLASGSVAHRVSETVTRISDGKLTLRFYGAGKLVPPLEIHDAVSAGSVDGGFTTPTFIVGKIPSAALLSGSPFSLEGTSLLAWLYEGGGLELWRELYAEIGIVPTPCGMMEPESGGWYSKEINSPKDFQGLKIRFGGVGAEVLRSLGASPVLLGGGDVFPSLERKVIDGAEFSMPALDRSIGFERAAQYYYVPGWHQPASVNELVVNEAVWNALSEAQRMLIETACQAAMVHGVTETQVPNAEALAFFEEAGVQIKSFTPETIEALREATAKVYADMAAKDPRAKKVLDSISEFRSKTAGWTTRSVLK